MISHEGQPFPLRKFFAEMIGVAVLLLVGLSLVIIMFGDGSPMARLIPELKIRQAITGFLFGGTGALISLTHVGKESGAHLNPVVTLSFGLFRKIDVRTTFIYILAQLTGAVLGAMPLLLWGPLGKSISFGATMPGRGYTQQDALMGEIIVTFMFISLLIVFISFRFMRPYTPLLSPVFFAIMVPLEADVSGISTNPARSFGPAVISGHWDSWWIYVAGPVTGAVIACLLLSRMARRITVAKLYHFDSDRDGMFRRMAT